MILFYLIGVVMFAAMFSSGVILSVLWGLMFLPKVFSNDESPGDRKLYALLAISCIIFWVVFLLLAVFYFGK